MSCNGRDTVTVDVLSNFCGSREREPRIRQDAPLQVTGLDDALVDDGSEPRSWRIPGRFRLTDDVGVFRRMTAPQGA
jgi:hypothetical protein